ncbi:major type 1 subunit fimbrin (pilin) [Paraburkholderia fungorum]|uniref:Major type 1 subunit fimbrin (Pilin) n=1 Tax=Paraburkholderia fungorum TaxID=134537 RepID=A0A1H1J0R4_9BURK|nr:fimbrial protein [Paraburkholderia fungorum]SDR43186.1 major type 1 subunit fimbrin (pilin) [Paraburkholderia fungorum]
MKSIFPAIVIATGSLLGFASMGAHASDGMLIFNGNISAQTCQINGTVPGKMTTVTLPTVSAAAMPSAGQSAGATPFSLTLSNCAVDSGTAHTYFEPSSSTTDPATGNLVNTGTASNVQVQLLNSDSSVIALNKADADQNSKSVNIDSGTATLNYNAQYIANGGAAGAGTVTSAVTFSMIYQ